MSVALQWHCCREAFDLCELSCVCVSSCQRSMPSCAANTFAATDRVISSNNYASVSATGEYTRHSVHVTQLYIGTTADNQLAPRQN